VYCLVAGEYGCDSDDDSLSDGDPDPSSDDDGCCSGNEPHCSSKLKNIPWDEVDEPHCTSTLKNIPWDEVDEQHLMAYKKERKTWSWTWQVPRYNRVSGTHALDHGLGQIQIDFSCRNSCWPNIYSGCLVPMVSMYCTSFPEYVGSRQYVVQ
jgi:hypothetical protein